ncbi:type II secretion system F family protein [Patescibacteria group bacterium]|nr:type II secretion system F family protein [Patescibacteria group bacterium]
MNKIKKIKLPKIGKIDWNKVKQINFDSFSKFSNKKQTFFAKRLSFLIKAGVPMLESMHVLRKQTKSKAEIKVLNKVILDISNGQSLATSLGRFKGVFGNFAINIIKAGESSGTLMQNLNYLADELSKKEILRKKIMSALLYPIIITIATFGITGMLIVYIFPKILPIFQSLKADLPLSTKIVIFFSDVVRNYSVYIFLFLVISVITITVLNRKIPKVKFVWHGVILRVPFVGPITQNYNLTNSTRTLGLLLKSGLSLTESLMITTDTTENVQFKKAYNDISKGVIKGKSISESITAPSYIFPEMLVHMVSIGEKSGNLSNTLIYLSEYFENEFDDQTKNLSSSIEPILMIVMGILVGFIAISIITPIYGITQHLNPR